MCVIISRPKTVLIPSHYIENACQKNSDGWGMAIADRGKLEIRRSYEEKGNNPDEINKLLEETKNVNVLLHLRLRSSGEKGLENCHPFVVLNDKEHGYDLVFAHNGTMSWFNRDREQKECDSWIFTQKILRDVCEKYWSLGIDPLEDRTVQEILQLAANDSNRFALMNGNGVSLLINKDKGTVFYNSKDERGNIPENQWWASNDWSFKDAYKVTTFFNGHTNHGGQGNRPFHQAETVTDKWHREKEERLAKEKASESSKTSTGSSKTTPDHPTSISVNTLSYTNPQVLVPPVGASRETFNDNLVWESAYMASKISEIVNSTDAPNMDFINNLLSKREKFTELCGISDLFEITCMDEDDILELISFAPELGTILIMDLLADLYKKRMDDGAFRAKVAASQYLQLTNKQKETQLLLTAAKETITSAAEVTETNDAVAAVVATDTPV